MDLDPSLVDRTNICSTPARVLAVGLLTPPSERKRVSQLELEGHDKKRVKLEWPQKKNENADTPSYSDSDSESDGPTLSQRVSRFSVYSLRNKASQSGPSCASRRVDVPTRSVLRSFVSSNKSDVFKCQSIYDNVYVNIPYACSYSNAARRGGTPHLAVATEQGTIDILTTSKRDDWDVEPQRVTLQPHANGVFDVKWSPSDTLIATASGDHSVRITTIASSVSEQDRTLHVLRGHEGTVKSIAWDPAHDGAMLCSGGRDGGICLWDLRVGERSEAGQLAPVLSIPRAHDLQGKPTKPKAPRGKIAPSIPLQSITHLLYTDTHPYGVISSSSSEGILNLWDVRLPSDNTTTTRSKAKRPPKQQRPKPLFTSGDPTTYAGARRGRGLTTLALGTGPSAALVFALGIDSRVHTYTLPTLVPLSGHGASVSMVDESYLYADPRMKTASFYVRMAASPCGRWLATGGGNEGRAYLYDISTAGRVGGIGSAGWGAGVELRGQKGEVGAVDWAEGMLATCADDGTVRVWRPDIDLSRRCREDPQEMGWNWAWSTDA
ncbi:WD40-repeat-containing domain protein [Lenzites betulinus]|nr:WD40-repeat-containing domain protein [Lenzites betulinus]